MMKKYDIELSLAEAPITEAVTKLGGQPVWLEAPEWPQSDSVGEPMHFIGQVRIDPDLFPGSQAQMAYIFMTDHPDVTDTWEPESGENAVILQPGNNTYVATKPEATGPTLQNFIRIQDKVNLEPVNVELAVKLTPGEDPDYLPENELFEQATVNVNELYRQLSADKVGGTPGFLRGEEFPDEGPWQLLMQLSGDTEQFDVNFGDGGTCYTFLNMDGTEARFLWQS